MNEILEPNLPWAAGCQMVALNFQAVKTKLSDFLHIVYKYYHFQHDRRNMMNKAKFMQNGNCGYVLKPNILFSKNYNLQAKEKVLQDLHQLL